MGDIKYLSSIALQDIGVITSIGRSHISGFGSVEAILEEKSEVIKNLPADGLAVVPFGQHVDFWNSVKTSEKLVTFGLDRRADYCFEIVSNDLDNSQQKIEVFIKQKVLDFFTQIYWVPIMLSI